MPEGIQQKQSRRPPRVHITFDVDNDGAIEKKEIPFIVGVLADLSGETKKKNLEERDFDGVANHNFDDLLGKKIKPTLNIKVKNMVNVQFKISKNIINEIDNSLKEKKLERTIISTIIEYYIDKYSLNESEWKSFVEESKKKIVGLKDDKKDALAKQLVTLENSKLYSLTKEDIITEINDLQKNDSENEEIYMSALVLINKKLFEDNHLDDSFTFKSDKYLQNEIDQYFSDKAISKLVQEKLMEKKKVKLSKENLKELDVEIKIQLPVNFILNEQEHIKAFYDYIFTPHKYKSITEEAIKSIIDECAYHAINIPLSFNKMDDFNPENLIEKVDELKKLRKTRDQLASLKGKTDGNYELISELDDIIKKLKNIPK